MVVRDRLLRAEPHEFMEVVDDAPEVAMVMHLAMRSFPPKSGGTLRRLYPVDPAESRAAYLSGLSTTMEDAELWPTDYEVAARGPFGGLMTAVRSA